MTDVETPSRPTGTTTAPAPGMASMFARKVNYIAILGNEAYCRL
jgi:hypothetical protein